MAIVTFYNCDPKDAPKTTMPAHLGSNAIITCQGKLLLEKRRDSDIWGMVGGGCKKYETGRDAIARAVAIANGRIQIMAGSGVSPHNALQLAATGVDALHFSAKQMIQGGMQYRNPRISMGGTGAVDEYALRTVNEEEVKTIVQLIKKQL